MPCRHFEDQHKFFAALARRENNAFRCLHKQTNDFCLKYARQDEYAKDVWQNTVIELVRRIETGRYIYQSGQISSYFITIFTSRWKDFLRRTHRAAEIPQDTLPEVADEIDPDDDQQRIRLAFERLGRLCRELLTLRIVSAKSYAEIGRLRQTTEETAKNQAYRCREELRTLFNSTNPTLFSGDDEAAFENRIAAIKNHFRNNATD